MLQASPSHGMSLSMIVRERVVHGRWCISRGAVASNCTYTLFVHRSHCAVVCRIALLVQGLHLEQQPAAAAPVAAPTKAAPKAKK